MHYDPNNANWDTELLLLKLDEYIESNGIRVEEIFYTGDFRFAKNQETTIENAKIAAEKLKAIAKKIGVNDASHIHIVPGNHDLDREKDSNTPLLKQVGNTKNNALQQEIIK